MTSYYRGDEQTAPPMQLQIDQIPRGDDPAGYSADEGLAKAVNVALILGKPLLLTGEAGTGKTALASHVAMALNFSGPEKFDTRSTSLASELFYRFDNLARFHSAHRGDKKQALDFITLGPLGRAILRTYVANDPRLEHLEGLLKSECANRKQPERSVVLIDEIDKAPRDFPNDLLEAIDKLTFTIRELEQDIISSIRAKGYPEEIAAQPPYKPLVIITSNSEKNLPDPFLRRCIYYHIPFPSEERLMFIVCRRVKSHALTTESKEAAVTSVSGDEPKPLLKATLSFFNALRDSDLRKRPSTAELIEWIQYLLASGITPDSNLSDVPRTVHDSLGILIKSKEDIVSAQKIADRLYPLPSI